MCSFPQTTHGSTRLIACVFFSTNNTWIHQWSLHVCSFHKLHVDPAESLHVCSYTQTSTRVIAWVFYPQTTHGSTPVITCVFFPQNTHGSTSGHYMYVLSTNHIWINQWS